MQITGSPKSPPLASLRVADVEKTIRDEAAQPLSYAYAEEYQPGATVAALDVYRPDAKSKHFHGDYVDAILTSKGLSDPDVQKISHGMSDEVCNALQSLLKEEGPGTASERLNGFIELSGSQKLIQTNGTLQQILQDPTSSLKVINQSQGNSRVDIFELLESAVKPKEGETGLLSPTGERLAHLLGVDTASPEFEMKVLKQRLADQVAEVIDHSPLIAAEQRRHSELLGSLRDKGVLMVTSAGNNADELDRVRSEGLKVSDNFDDDLTSVGPKMIVGAIDTSKDDQIAFFSSRYSAVNLLAPGVGFETTLGKVTGTSFAAPQVAAEAEGLRRQHPDWSVDQLESETKKRFTQTDGFNILS